MPDNIIDELSWRGLIAQCTDLEGLRQRVREPIKLYCGFDPTADSLHVGNLIPLIALRRFQQKGHTPIALAGGATGLVGDPGGKANERPLLSREDLNRNLKGIKPQLERLLCFIDPNTNTPILNSAILVDNADWTASMTYLDFLRDVGKHITVNYMMAKEWVRNRMGTTTHSEMPIHTTHFIESSGGLSYTEFSYMLIQANDFYHLYQNKGCELQVAGTDQWGNITAGTELTRKKTGKSVYGLTFPLLTNADGTKFGKSVAGAVWLDPKKTRIEDFYQFWIQTDDRDVIQRLKYFTFLDEKQIADLEQKLKSKPEERAAQKALAKAMTELIHGREILKEAQPKEGVESIFTITAEKLRTLSGQELEDAILGVPDLPTPVLGIHEVFTPTPLIDLLVIAGLADSKSEARRAIEAGGITINKATEKDLKRIIQMKDMLEGSCKLVVLGKGKRNFVKIRLFKGLQEKS